MLPRWTLVAVVLLQSLHSALSLISHPLESKVTRGEIRFNPLLVF